MGAKDVLGKEGEQAAVSYLERCGFRILDRNWRCADGEIDIVAADRHTFVVCEVKTRSGTRFGTPLEAVGQAKRRRLRRLAALWLAAHGSRLTRYGSTWLACSATAAAGSRSNMSGGWGRWPSPVPTRWRWWGSAATSSRWRRTSQAVCPRRSSSDFLTRHCARRVTGSGAAIVNSGESWPNSKITVGLSPATLPKRGSGFDLAIAVAILAAAEAVPAAALANKMFLAELGLDGRLLGRCPGYCPPWSRPRPALTP